MRLSHVAICLSIVFSTAEATAEICRSTRYSGLAMDTRVLRNAEGFLADVLGQYPVKLNNSFRSYAEQDSLYGAWKARGQIGNPAAKPGTSRHESGFALDLSKLQQLTFIQWDRILNAGQKYGFKYLTGDWPGEGSQKFDWPHFEADPTTFGETLKGAIVNNRISSLEISDCPWKNGPAVEQRAYQQLVSVTNVRAAVLQGTRNIYLEGRLTNNGLRDISQLELRFECQDSLGETTLVRLVHPITGHADALKPGETRSFQLPLGAPGHDLEEASALRVTYIGF